MTAERDRELRDDRRDGRDETPSERADRNFSDVLQELRVLQTGSQILFGFLLALAFQPAFADLSDIERAVYLGLIVAAAVSAVLALAPVALHRVLYGRLVKPRVAAYGHGALIAALISVSMLLVGVVAFVFDVVVGGPAAMTVAVALGVFILLAWWAAPLAIRRRHALERSGS